MCNVDNYRGPAAEGNSKPVDVLFFLFVARGFLAPCSVVKKNLKNQPVGRRSAGCESSCLHFSRRDEYH